MKAHFIALFVFVVVASAQYLRLNPEKPVVSDQHVDSGVLVAVELLQDHVGEVIVTLNPGRHAMASECSIVFKPFERIREIRLYPGNGVETLNSNQENMFDHPIKAEITASKDPGLDAKKQDLVITRRFTPRGVCSSIGDPHFCNFDEKEFSNYQLGWHTLVKNAYTTIQTEHYDCGTTQYCNGGLAIRHGDEIVYLTMERTGQLNYSLKRNKEADYYIQIHHEADGDKDLVIKLKDDTKVLVSFKRRRKHFWYMNVYVDLPGIYANRVNGLCGNFNGNPGDDAVEVDPVPTNELCATFKCKADPYNFKQHCETPGEPRTGSSTTTSALTSTATRDIPPMTTIVTTSISKEFPSTTSYSSSAPSGTPDSSTDMPSTTSKNIPSTTPYSSLMTSSSSAFYSEKSSTTSKDVPATTSYSRSASSSSAASFSEKSSATSKDIPATTSYRSSVTSSSAASSSEKSSATSKDIPATTSYRSSATSSSSASSSDKSSATSKDVPSSTSYSSSATSNSSASSTDKPSTTSKGVPPTTTYSSSPTSSSPASSTGQPSMTSSSATYPSSSSIVPSTTTSPSYPSSSPVPPNKEDCESVCKQVFGNMTCGTMSTSFYIKSCAADGYNEQSMEGLLEIAQGMLHSFKLKCKNTVEGLIDSPIPSDIKAGKEIASTYGIKYRSQGSTQVISPPVNCKNGGIQSTCGCKCPSGYSGMFCEMKDEEIIQTVTEVGRGGFSSSSSRTYSLSLSLIVLSGMIFFSIY